MTNLNVEYNKVHNGAHYSSSRKKINVNIKQDHINHSLIQRVRMNNN